MKYQYATIQIRVTPELRQDSAHSGLMMDILFGHDRNTAIARQARRTGYVIADRPAWPAFRLFRWLPRG